MTDRSVSSPEDALAKLLLPSSKEILSRAVSKPGEEMRRRALLNKSAIGMAALGGVCTGNLTAEGDGLNEKAGVTGLSSDTEVVTEEEGQLAWGINAVVLRSPWISSPSLNDLLSDGEHTLALNRFFRASGQNGPVTPTECRIAYNSQAIFVGFRCKENDLSFLYANLDSTSDFGFLPMRTRWRDGQFTKSSPVAMNICRSIF
jgi:hypothetical protein